MKLFLTALFASFMVIPAVFADEDCGKCKKGTEKKQEGTMLVHCGKCEGDKKKEEKKAEGTMLAHCGKCEGDKKKEEKKAEGTIA